MMIKCIEPANYTRHPPGMPRLSIFDRKPPLSMLTAAQLLDLAHEFQEMALNASSLETRQALTRLVVRYVAYAAGRELEEIDATRH